MLDSKLEEAPPAPARGVFEGGKGSCKHLRMQLCQAVGSVVSAVEPVTLLLACSVSSSSTSMISTEVVGHLTL